LFVVVSNIHCTTKNRFVKGGLLIRTGSLYPPVVVIDIVFGVEVICEGGMKSHGVSYLIKGHVLLNEAQHHFRGSVKPYSVVLLSLL